MIDPACPRLYLASRSPRRRELLTQIGIVFDPIAASGRLHGDDEVDETPLPGEAPLVYVARVARDKAESGWRAVGRQQLNFQPVLAADTTIDLDDVIVGKPLDADDAKSILRRLSGRSHRVLTAVAVAFDGRIESALSISEVRFCRLDEAQICRYVASGEPLDKAGAYGIQGRAGQFVEKLCGSYSGVMGLPLFETAELLRRFGFPV